MEEVVEEVVEEVQVRGGGKRYRYEGLLSIKTTRRGKEM